MLQSATFRLSLLHTPLYIRRSRQLVCLRLPLASFAIPLGAFQLACCGGSGIVDHLHEMVSQSVKQGLDSELE